MLLCPAHMRPDSLLAGVLLAVHHAKPHATQASRPAAVPARWGVRAMPVPRCARCAALQRSLLHAPGHRRRTTAQRPRRPLAAAPRAAGAQAATADSHGQGTLQQGDHDDAYDASNALHRVLARVFGRLGLMQLAEALEHDTRVSVALVVLIAVAGAATIAAGMPGGQHPVSACLHSSGLRCSCVSDSMGALQACLHTHWREQCVSLHQC